MMSEDKKPDGWQVGCGTFLTHAIVTPFTMGMIWLIKFIAGLILSLFKLIFLFI